MMPHFASKKQYRMMMAILHGKKGTTARGDSGPPKSVAEEYSGNDKNAPESKGKEHEGGKWGESHKEKHTKQKEHKKKWKENLKEKTKKLKEKHMGKTEGRPGYGVVVMDEGSRVLMGRHTKTNEWATSRWIFRRR